MLNPFLANVPNLHPLKTPENLRAYKKGTLARIGLGKYPEYRFSISGNLEAVVRKGSVKKVFPCEFCQISKNTFFL